MRYITGIKPTGTPHLGNYLSMMKPIFDLARNKDNFIYCFIADGHAMTTQPKSRELERNVDEVCTTLFSLGIQDFSNVILYRQSQVPEIFELFWMLSCFTAKGLLNRNHSYMVETQKNIEKGKDQDDGINAGLFNYPVLMASDILCVDSERVLVGKDQKQHIDITRDVGERVNSFYNKEIFTIPEEYYATDGSESIPGLDGRKMSKSYDNIIPLFCSEKKLRKLIFSIPTNSKDKGEQKYKEESNVCYLLEQFGNDRDIDEMNILLEGGNSWGDVKQLAFDIINETIKEQRNSYEHYIQNKSKIYSYLRENERNIIRPNITKKLQESKDITGLIC